MSESLRRLHPAYEDLSGGDPGPRKVDVPAIGFSLQVDLGAGRVGVFQTAMPNDCSLPELNRMLDKMNRAGDRQRAHYKIEEEERSIELLKKEQAQHQEDLDAVDKRFFADMETLRQSADRAQKTIDNFMATARDAHVESGRRGEFELKGAQKSQYNTTATGVAKAKEEMAMKQTEFDKTHAQWNDLHKRREDLIVKHTADLERYKALVAAGLQD